MVTLRRLIRQIILEGPVKDSFDELWYNTEEERNSYNDMGSEEGTYHRENLRDQMPHYFSPYPDEYIDQFFEDKRDLKRLWNETIDANGLRSFWEGPKMKYFHSLAYYTPGGGTFEDVGHSIIDDNDLSDLKLGAFLRKYKKSGHRDEMSCWGVYMPDPEVSMCRIQQQVIGVLLSGRVTMALRDDAWTESRSKATPKDIKRHKQSGMPKRVMPTNSNVGSLLFEEIDILEGRRVGECVLDNWGIEAIVYHPGVHGGKRLEEYVKQLSKTHNIPVVDARDIW